MSIESWKDEFYPTEAHSCPADQAIEHSLRKWRGLRAPVLVAHGVTLKTVAGFFAVWDGERARDAVEINADSCALCERFFDDADDDHPCKRCPLSLVRNGVACVGVTPNEYVSPWSMWERTQNPEPMISALEKALEWQKAQNKAGV